MLIYFQASIKAWNRWTQLHFVAPRAQTFTAICSSQRNHKRGNFLLELSQFVNETEINLSWHQFILFILSIKQFIVFLTNDVLCKFNFPYVYVKGICMWIVQTLKYWYLSFSDCLLSELWMPHFAFCRLLNYFILLSELFVCLHTYISKKWELQLRKHWVVLTWVVQFEMSDDLIMSQRSVMLFLFWSLW